LLWQRVGYKTQNSPRQRFFIFIFKTWGKLVSLRYFS